MTISQDFSRSYSKAPWERQVGYCRALRAGNQVFVTGTAPTDDNGNTFAPNQPYQQAKRCFSLIERALQDHGIGLNAVVRTRMFVTNIDFFDEFGRAHFESFNQHPPTTTMVEVSRLVKSDMLIEVEADAFILD